MLIKRILVIDDDEAIRMMVEEKLTYDGYEVWCASDGKHALDIIDRHGLPHLAVVDINMPNMDGFEFCDIVHKYADLPVIMLTAVNEERTILRGIKYYAEDYVTKPFSPSELAARVERVLRRIGDFSYTLESKIKIDETLEVDLAHQEVCVGGKTVKLTPTENKILHVLLRNAPRVATTNLLLERIWPQESVLEDVLRVHIHRLRNKIEKEAGDRKYILTERNLGYSFREN